MKKLTATTVKQAKARFYSMSDRNGLFRTKLIFMTLILIPELSMSAETEPWSKFFVKSVDSHLIEGVAKGRNDLAGFLGEMIYLSQRCYGGLAFIGITMERANPELSQEYLSQAEKSMFAGAQFSSAYERQTGNQQSIESYENGLKLMVQHYTNWGNDNYISSGQNTNSNMLHDLGACNQFVDAYYPLTIQGL